MAPFYLGKRVVPSSLRYIENLAYQVVATLDTVDSEGRHLSWWTANMGGWCV